jgi:hypothetical protein
MASFWAASKRFPWKTLDKNGIDKSSGKRTQPRYKNRLLSSCEREKNPKETILHCCGAQKKYVNKLNQKSLKLGGEQSMEESALKVFKLHLMLEKLFFFLNKLSLGGVGVTLKRKKICFSMRK